ncbi:MAG: lysophospholipid acyltransferase family protein [Flavobacteriales bacterium]|jgi:1-acyl-sn-glycerol-3-phosphate acyltransferase|nr:lysophospholipid acyltransferase family protein [Flavobacteriales bacterium]|tara:strand:- start:5380 stop:6009 length:630 start_codon:yes stop_codon:yes gene_type:complete
MVYPIAKVMFKPIVNLWVKEVGGLENLPKKGAFIVVANHASYMDHLIIMCTLVPHLNRKVHFLSKKEHFSNPIKSMWHRWAGAIPLDRQAGGKEALRWAVKALKQGKIIAIHPEGTRTLTGKLQKGKTGIVRLALAAKVPVVPVGLIRTFEILPKGKYIPRLKRATMNIGKPMYFKKYYNKKITKTLLRKITKETMKEIARLCNQKYNF